MRHGARRLRDVLGALLDARVLALLDELADRPQVATMPALVALRQAVRLPGLGVARASASMDVDAYDGELDGWPLDAEVLQ